MSNHFRLFMQVFITALLFAFYASSYSDPLENEIPIVAPAQILPTQNIDQSLQDELHRYELALAQTWPTIPDKLLKPGMKGATVLLVRTRLQQTGDLSSIYDTNSLKYDEDLMDAVKKFQLRHGLQDDGVIGQKTAFEMNISPQDRINQIQMNMQRWAELSKHLGTRYAMVNIPEYQLHLFEDGQEVLTMKTIVGKPTLQTPELSSRITRIVFNPYWNVPDKIAAKDVVPKVLSDPYYLDDMHIKVFIRDSDHSREVNHHEIDWARVNTEDIPYDFRQEPGDDNALGAIKFEFPNTYNVYLHDTPAKTLFDDSLRALSHGCVRLENPMGLVDYLMKDDPKWDVYRAQELIDRRDTAYVRVKKPLSIFITYFTVWVDETGTVNYRDDIYAKDLNKEM